jgi:hypothetical protein
MPIGRRLLPRRIRAPLFSRLIDLIRFRLVDDCCLVKFVDFVNELIGVESCQRLTDFALQALHHELRGQIPGLGIELAPFLHPPIFNCELWQACV